MIYIFFSLVFVAWLAMMTLLVVNLHNHFKDWNPTRNRDWLGRPKNDWDVWP